MALCAALPGKFALRAAECRCVEAEINGQIKSNEPTESNENPSSFNPVSDSAYALRWPQWALRKPPPAACSMRRTLIFPPDHKTGSRDGGRYFLTTYSFYPQVNWLGYYDQNGGGLANSHLVTLWDNNTQASSPRP